MRLTRGSPRVFFCLAGPGAVCGWPGSACWVFGWAWHLRGRDLYGRGVGLFWVLPGAFSVEEEFLSSGSGRAGRDIARKVHLGRVFSVKKSGRMGSGMQTGGLAALTYCLRGRMSGAERPRTSFQTGLSEDSPHFFGEKVRDRLTPDRGPPIISLAPQRGASNLKAR